MLISQKTINPLDAELLLAHVLKKNRAWLMAHPDTPLSDQQKKEFDSLVTRRKNHEPIAYILNEKEFYGRSFYVDERVLIPRPSTETLIDVTKQFLRDPKNTPTLTKADNGIVIYTHKKNPLSPIPYPLSPIPYPLSLVDIGTGSGCIAITLAHEIPDIQIVATDISEDALTVARQNAEHYNLHDRIIFLLSSLFSSNLHQLLSFPFLIVSNPPYIPADENPEPDVIDFEPHEALFAGPKGMDVLHPLFTEAKKHPQCMGCILECTLSQAKKLASQL